MRAQFPLHRWAYGLTPLFVVMLVTGVILLFSGNGHDATNKSVQSNHKVVLGQDYYVGVQLVELNQHDGKGKDWDSLDSSAPDPFFTIKWQDQIIFTSSVKSDSLIAQWSEAELDIRKMALEGIRASLDDVISGGRVRIAPDLPITITIYDKDLVATDEIGSFKVDTRELAIGEQTFDNPIPGVKRLVLRTLPLESLPHLFQESKNGKK